jgi:hypothetical protein
MGVTMTTKAIVLGSTGMVGEGVLHECLKHAEVESVLVINRRSCGVQHDKLTELIHPDFHDFSRIKTQLSGYNTCYFCMGMSSVGKKEAEYRQITYDITLHVANILVEQNPHMTFCYVSGTGTDSTEQGRIMWARVKGKTENDLLKLPFKDAFMFRPGYIQPIKGQKNAYKIYKYMTPFYPILKTLFPNSACTLEDLGLAMIEIVQRGYEKQIINNKDIFNLANRQRQNLI